MVHLLLELLLTELVHKSNGGFAIYIGVGTGKGGTGKARAPPIFYPRDFINIYTCSADRRVAVYITFGPPKMELLPIPMTYLYHTLGTRQFFVGYDA